MWTLRLVVSYFAFFPFFAVVFSLVSSSFILEELVVAPVAGFVLSDAIDSPGLKGPAFYGNVYLLPIFSLFPRIFIYV